jgi:hypothetical protein
MPRQSRVFLPDAARSRIALVPELAEASRKFRARAMQTAHIFPSLPSCKGSILYRVMDDKPYCKISVQDNPREE